MNRKWQIIHIRSKSTPIGREKELDGRKWDTGNKKTQKREWMMWNEKKEKKMEEWGKKQADPYQHVTLSVSLKIHC